MDSLFPFLCAAIAAIYVLKRELGWFDFSKMRSWLLEPVFSTAGVDERATRKGRASLHISPMCLCLDVRGKSFFGVLIQD